MNILAKKIPSILGLVILIAGLIAGIILVRRQQTQPQAAIGGEPIDLSVSNVNEGGFSVSWTTAAAVSGRVTTGSGGQLTEWVSDARDAGGKMSESTTHFVIIGGLKPATGYEFRVESGGRQYDKGGRPFSVKTAPNLAGILPASDVAQGIVRTAGGGPGAGAIVYAQLPGGQLLAALTSDSGNWILPLSTSRSGDLSSWLAYDRTAAVYTIRADGGKDGNATAVVTTGIDQPVPPLALGQNYDFRQPGRPEQSTISNQQSTIVTQAPLPDLNLSSLFNFEDLGPVTPVAEDVTLLNPSEEGERISTTKPELFGEGPKGVEVNIKVESAGTITGNAVVGDDGKWRYGVPADLSEGKHTVTLTWIDAEGILQTLKRSFTVQAAAGEPAFTASPSAVPTKKLTPTPTLSARQTAPATTSGTPKSGGLTPSVMLFMMGIVLIISGSRLLANSKHG